MEPVLIPRKATVGDLCGKNDLVKVVINLYYTL